MKNKLIEKEKDRKSAFQVKAICSLSWVFLIGAVVAFLSNWFSGPVTAVFGRFECWDFGFSLGVRIDSISATMLVMIALLGVVIATYSDRYLSGEVRRDFFFRNFFGVLVSSLLLVAAPNLAVLFLSWLGVSLFLHQLLVYCNDRPAAVNAARKKFIISRVGDLALISGSIIIYKAFGTVEFSELFEKARLVAEGTEQAEMIGLAGFLFVLGAMVKSAQFPFHFWLPETMESPTPVSALMHAGVINAGGFLIIRLSPMLEQAIAAHFLLAIVGSITAVFGAIVMVTQNHLKSKLAYSTISQMGMMLFACGLGTYSLALIHIVAHSFYKAHSFLSTGSQVEESKGIRFAYCAEPRLFLILSGLTGLGILAFGLVSDAGLYLPYYTYAAVLFLGLVQNLWTRSLGRGLRLIYVSSSIALSAFLFIVLELTVAKALGGALGNIHSQLNWFSGEVALFVVSYLVFFSGFYLTAALRNSTSTRMQEIYVFFWNGAYFSAYSSQLLEKLFGKPKVRECQSHGVQVSVPVRV